jgi:hypothetical protein
MIHYQRASSRRAGRAKHLEGHNLVAVYGTVFYSSHSPYPVYYHLKLHIWQKL